MVTNIKIYKLLILNIFMTLITDNYFENRKSKVLDERTKQDSLKELRANDKLRQNIVDLLERVKKYEDNSLRFLGRRSNFLCGHSYQKYKTLPDTRELIGCLSGWAQELPEPETSYLKQLKKDIISLKGSGVEKLARGPVFRKLFKKE